VRAKILSHANTTLGKIPYGVLLGKICYAAAPRQMPWVPEPIRFSNADHSNAGAGEGI
jgi:hypothetical protein